MRFNLEIGKTFKKSRKVNEEKLQEEEKRVKSKKKKKLRQEKEFRFYQPHLKTESCKVNWQKERKDPKGQSVDKLIKFDLLCPYVIFGALLEHH